MSYENPQVPHHVNVGRDNPLAEFLRLVAGAALVVGVLSLTLYFAGGQLARYIPFATEKSWVADRVLGIDVKTSRSAANAAVQAYLERLTRDLAVRMDLPDGMTINVHFSEMDVPNAFATLGGHIVVTSALYRLMPSENALAMVVAHEIGHVKARDPISALGGVATLALTLALLSGDVNGLSVYVGQVVQRGYSRRAESRADEAAVSGLRRYYGHAGGSAAVFQVLSRYTSRLGDSMPSLLATHPADADRIARLEAAAADWDRVRQPLRPLAVSAPTPTPKS